MLVFHKWNPRIFPEQSMFQEFTVSSYWIKHNSCNSLTAQISDNYEFSSRKNMYLLRKKLKHFKLLPSHYSKKLTIFVSFQLLSNFWLWLFDCFCNSTYLYLLRLILILESLKYSHSSVSIISKPFPIFILKKSVNNFLKWTVHYFPL